MAFSAGAARDLMTADCMTFIAQLVDQYPVRGKRILELGSYNVNGSVRGLFDGCADYIGIDSRHGPGVDEVIDAHHIFDRFGLGSMDVIVTTEMLEHDALFWLTFEEVSLVLKAKGHFWITTRNIGYGKHDAPNDFYRFTADGLTAALKWAGFADINAIDDEEHQGTYASAVKP